MNDTYVITQEGYDKLKGERHQLKEQKRPEAVARLKKAREMGDLSENSEYLAAKEALSFVDSRLAELEILLKKAKVVAESTSKTNVKVGDTVEVNADGERDTFTVVGELEGDITQKKLSAKSPIGEALLGKKKGDKVEVKIPAGKVLYKILDIK